MTISNIFIFYYSVINHHLYLWGKWMDTTATFVALTILTEWLKILGIYQKSSPSDSEGYTKNPHQVIESLRDIPKKPHKVIESQRDIPKVHVWSAATQTGSSARGWEPGGRTQTPKLTPEVANIQLISVHIFQQEANDCSYLWLLMTNLYRRPECAKKPIYMWFPIEWLLVQENITRSSYTISYLWIHTGYLKMNRQDLLSMRPKVWRKASWWMVL